MQLVVHCFRFSIATACRFSEAKQPGQLAKELAVHCFRFRFSAEKGHSTISSFRFWLYLWVHQYK